MNPHYTYLLVDLACLIMPFVFSFYPGINFYKKWRYFIIPCLLTAAFFLVWDGIFTNMHIWSFNPKYVMGIYWFNMPVEEYLFFFCIPFACVFTYYALSKLTSLTRFQVLAKGFFFILAIALLAIALANIGKLYTSTTFILLGICLLCFCYKNYSFLPSFLASYLLILIPFTISNGILTGSFLHRVIVSYNNSENLGIRLLTIPIEDIFYGMLLLLLNVYGFERSQLMPLMLSSGNKRQPSQNAYSASGRQ